MREEEEEEEEKGREGAWRRGGEPARVPFPGTGHEGCVRFPFPLSWAAWTTLHPAPTVSSPLGMYSASASSSASTCCLPDTRMRTTSNKTQVTGILGVGGPLGYEHPSIQLTQFMGLYGALWSQKMGCKMKRCGDFQSWASSRFSPLRCLICYPSSLSSQPWRPGPTLTGLCSEAGELEDSEKAAQITKEMRGPRA